MKYLKNAFDLYINSSIHVSLAVVSFTIISFWKYGLTLNSDLLFFIFFASITGYNFVKYAGIAKLHHLSLARNLRLIQIFSLGSFVALLFFAFQLPLRLWIANGILGLLTLFYAIPFLGGEKNLRSLPGLKIFIIAIVWAGCTVLLPLIEAERLLGFEELIDFFQRLSFVIVLILPFEIRDMEYDNRNLGTIPQKIGYNATKVFGTVLLGLVLIIELLQNNFTKTNFLSLFLVVIVTGIFLWKAKKRQAKYYCSFWVEMVPIIYLGVYWIMTHYF